MAKAGAVLTIVVGVLLVASSVAHCTLGLPPLRRVLVEAAIDAETVQALSVGWYFGSAAMLAFGVIALGDGLSRLSGKSRPRLALLVVAITYVVFGLTAYTKPMSGRWATPR